MSFDPGSFLRPLPIRGLHVPLPVVNRGDTTTHRLPRGDSLFDALIKAVKDLSDSAPAEHDVLVEASGIYITKTGFIEPHAFLLNGYDDNGNETSIVAHFSQLVTRVVYLPKKGPDRVYRILPHPFRTRRIGQPYSWGAPFFGAN
jgi:hypothetical protein